MLLSECHQISRILLNIDMLASRTEAGTMGKLAAEKSDFFDVY